MRVPQVSERIKEAPAQALRGVFAGIGQLLLVSDKLRNKTPADVARNRAAERAKAAATAEPAGAQEPAAAQESAAAQEPTAEAKVVAPESVVAEDVVAEQAAGAESAVAAAKPVAAKPAAAAKPTAAKPAAAAKPARDFDRTGNVRLLAGREDAAATAAASPAVAAQDVPPLPNYGELSIASLRARLRNLDVTQLKQVADYERAHAGRVEVIAMFERRAAKLEAEAGPEAGA